MEFSAQKLDEVLESPVVIAVRKVSEKTGIKSYIVGGYVRDFLIQRNTKDIDILVLGSGTDFAEAVADELHGKSYLSVFKNFGTANLKWHDEEIEFVGARKESYQQNSRNPIVTDGTLEDDISRRDFTINALAISLNNSDLGEFVDLYNGIEDLENGILRTPLNPDITFSDDPLRIMRAIRFASQLNFKIEDKTWSAIIKNKDRLSIITHERITDELNKIILSSTPSVGFLLLHKAGILKDIFPEFTALEGVKVIGNIAHKDNFYHTLQVLDGVAKNSDDLWLRWAAILHDIAKPPTQRFTEESGWTFHGHEVVGSRMTAQIFKRMKLPMNEKMKFVQKMVFLHLRPIALTQDVTDSAIRRIIVDAGEDIDKLLTLCRADITSKNEEKVKRYLRRFDEVEEKIKLVTEKDNLRNWKNPITGEIIMDTFNIPPSRLIGDIKDAVKEAIMVGEIQNDYEESYQFMLKFAAEKGLNKAGK